MCPKGCICTNKLFIWYIAAMLARMESSHSRYWTRRQSGLASELQMWIYNSMSFFLSILSFWMTSTCSIIWIPLVCFSCSRIPFPDPPLFPSLFGIPIYIFGAYSLTIAIERDKESNFKGQFSNWKLTWTDNSNKRGRKSIYLIHCWSLFITSTEESKERWWARAKTITDGGRPLCLTI